MVESKARTRKVRNISHLLSLASSRLAVWCHHNIGSPSLPCCVRPHIPMLGPSGLHMGLYTTTALRASAAAILSAVLRAEARRSPVPIRMAGGFLDFRVVQLLGYKFNPVGVALM